MTKKNIFSILVILSIVPIVILSKHINRNLKIDKVYGYNYVNGIILEVVDEKIEKHDLYPNRYVGRQELQVKITQGQLKDQIFTIQNPVSPERNIIAYKGMKAIFTIREKDGKHNIWLYSYKNDTGIYILSSIFVLIVAYLGRSKGLRSILSLVYTGIILFFVLIPLIFRGFNPILSSVIIASYIIFISFMLIGDYDKKTLSAIFGTISGIFMAGLLAFVFGKLGRLSSVHQEYGDQILYLTSEYQIKIDGLIFVSMLIASLGAVMDVAMSIASSAHELSKTIHTREKLYMSCINIGRDIMGTMINTLILAFAGSSLNLLLMAWGYRMTFVQLINMPALSIEIIQALAGSIGIVFTVPITAFLSVFVIEKINKEGSNE